MPILKSKTFFSLLLLVIAISGTVFYFKGGNIENIQTCEKKQGSLTNVEFDNWKLFCDKDNGIAFLYPPKLNLETCEGIPVDTKENYAFYLGKGGPIKECDTKESLDYLKDYQIGVLYLHYIESEKLLDLRAEGFAELYDNPSIEKFLINGHQGRLTSGSIKEQYRVKYQPVGSKHLTFDVLPNKGVFLIYYEEKLSGEEEDIFRKITSTVDIFNPKK